MSKEYESKYAYLCIDWWSSIGLKSWCSRTAQNCSNCSNYYDEQTAKKTGAQMGRNKDKADDQQIREINI